MVARPTAIEKATADRLSSLPPQPDPTYPQAIRTVIESLPDPEKTLARIIERPSNEHAVRFNALYGLLLRLRREERFTEYASAVARYEPEFRSEPYFNTFRAIIERGRGDNISLRRAVSFSRDAAKEMPDVAGVLHQVAAFAAEYFERSETTPSPKELAEAEQFVDRAIALSDGKISHYYETKARILSLQGDFDDARTAIIRALELEPRNSRDYQRRLMEYQATRIKIDLLQQQSRWDALQEQNRKDLADFKSEQLQLLGLLAAVVAFIVSAANIATKIGATDGVRLIQGTAGALVIVFATLSLMTNRGTWRVAVAYGIGALLIVSAVKFKI